MVLEYGEPTVGNGYSTHKTSWEQCYSMCYWNANCSLCYHYSFSCKLYAYGNYTIKHLNRNDGKLIGMKRNLTTSICPNAPTGTDSYNDNGVVYRQHISSNVTCLFITYTITLECDSGTKLFRRDNYWVCVGVQLFADCSPYDTAEKVCKENGWESVTGPTSIEEMDYFLSLKGSETKGFRPLLWVDGKRGKLADRTNIGYKQEVLQWSSIGTTKCAYIGFPTPPKKIGTQTCGDYKSGVNCWIGATCLKRYLEIN